MSYFQQYDGVIVRVRTDSNPGSVENCWLLPHIWTIMLKLHLIVLLSICYTSKFATSTVTNQTDGA